MRLLLDTHALLWFLEDAPQLGEAARLEIESPENERWVSIASGWEMAIKSRLGKLRLPLPFDLLFPARLESLGFRILPITAPHLHELHTLPLHHRDPFDRLLIAQARTERLTIAGGDAAFDAYGVARVW